MAQVNVRGYTRRGKPVKPYVRGLGFGHVGARNRLASKFGGLSVGQEVSYRHPQGTITVRRVPNLGGLARSGTKYTVSGPSFGTDMRFARTAKEAARHTYRRKFSGRVGGKRRGESLGFLSHSAPKSPASRTRVSGAGVAAGASGLTLPTPMAYATQMATSAAKIARTASQPGTRVYYRGKLKEMNARRRKLRSAAKVQSGPKHDKKGFRVDAAAKKAQAEYKAAHAHYRKTLLRPKATFQQIRKARLRWEAAKDGLRGL